MHVDGQRGCALREGRTGIRDEEQTDASTAPAVVPAMSECIGFSFFDMVAAQRAVLQSELGLSWAGMDGEIEEARR